MFNLKNISVGSTHNYLTPGIKNIKSIVYSRSKSTTEPLRWKLVTTRIFLDIPVSEFPDFNEVGGADYTTLPWPYTAPVIGGVSQDSKYIKSVEGILGSGKIGDNDIIDETFLVDSKENDELGKNIQKMDLEQVRFFNSSYDMNKLLKIPTTPQAQDISPEFLSTLQFPQYVEEFDYNDDGNVSVTDTVGWVDVGRPDIYDYLIELITTNATNSIPNGNGSEQPVENFFNPTYDENLYYPNPYIDTSYWDGSTSNKTFPDKSSVGQIFIGDNLDKNLVENCSLELNTGNLTFNVVDDSSGNINKGLLIGDYKIKKTQKDVEMRRDSYVKIPKKDNKDGAL